MSDIMEFANREEFRKWLYEHCLSNSLSETRMITMKFISDLLIC